MSKKSTPKCAEIIYMTDKCYSDGVFFTFDNDYTLEEFMNDEVGIGEGIEETEILEYKFVGRKTIKRTTTLVMV